MHNTENGPAVVTHTIGGGFAGLLTIAFIVLKLTGTIDWSWWWVLAPLWIPAFVAVAVIGMVVALAKG